jgi:hypothetical protein
MKGMKGHEEELSSSFSSLSSWWGLNQRGSLARQRAHG